jgi:glycine cleavage system H lipoate-binding protein
MQGAIEAIEPAAQVEQIKAAIPIPDEASGAIVAALNDVQGHSSHNDACVSRHARPTDAINGG